MSCPFKTLPRAANKENMRCFIVSPISLDVLAFKTLMRVSTVHYTSLLSFDNLNLLFIFYFVDFNLSQYGG